MAGDWQRPVGKVLTGHHQYVTVGIVKETKGLGFTTGTWRDKRPGVGTWTVRAYWAEVDGRPECVGLGLWKGCEPTEGGDYRNLPGSQGPSRVLTSDLRIALREPIARLRKEAQRREGALRARAETVAKSLPADAPPEIRKTFAALASHSSGFDKKVGGRYQAEHWARVAAVYMKAWENDENPTQAVSDQLKLSYSTASKHVARAKDEGYLPRLGQGRAGIVAKRARKKEKG
jgi:DNA-binding transcriptional ArsR family regulator